MGDKPSWIEKITDWSGAFTTVLAVVTTVVSIYTSYAASEAERAAKKAELAIAERSEVREAKATEREWQLKVFEKAYSALESERSQQQDAALALVISLEPGTMRDGLILAFRRTATPGVAAQAERVVAAEREFSAQEIADRANPSTQGSSVTAAVGPGTTILSAETRGYDVDVLWCDGGGSAPARYQKALQIGQAFASISKSRQKLAGENIGGVRLRLLPESTNATPAYRIANNVIFYDPAIPGKPEQAVAGALGGRASAMLPGPVEVRPVASGTDWRLFVYICGSVQT